ncbi:MAG: porin [Gallionella sp.]
MNAKHCFVALISMFACVVNAEAAGADAAGIDKPMFTFGGFGSLGVSYSSMGLGDYVPDSSYPSGPGISGAWSTTNDTRIAAHVAAQFTPQISAVLQVDSEFHSSNTYQPEVEFANVKYDFTPDISLRAGRLSLPTFLESENRDIGYTYAWIHPPVEVYRQEPIAHADAVDASYRLQTGEVGNSIKALYGRSTFESNDFTPTSDLSSKQLWGIFDTVEYGSTTLHVGYQQRETDSEDLLTNESGSLVKESDLSAGVQYDPGDWFAMSEWIQHESTYKTSAMYVSAGYRVKKFTPYLTYAQNSPGSFLPGFPPPSSEAIVLANRSQSTVSLGVRWDFMKDTDIKFQYDQVKLSDDSNGFLANVPPNVTLYGQTFHVISAVVDFIF